MGESGDPYFVPTRSSVRGVKHEVVVFSEKRHEKKPVVAAEKSNIKELDMKQARFEIYKFAQTGLTNPDKHKSNKELALALGAVPPKNKYLNYKKLKEERKREKEEKNKKKDLFLLGKQFRPDRYDRKRTDSKAVLKQKRKIGSGILNVYGTVLTSKVFICSIQPIISRVHIGI
ncbi:uncharacterized protein C1orf131-like isoform X1 [Cimex lectularius]|uniref:Uncharacterized protein n=1 Tax=Cimex lectularius TaxID=79782 RepID=A0A8I6SLZ3_CIMLE|nr:uncharacterized protein C1orf131-like isoform X1 [Cimex lectularius]XP_024083572.1 uncharacterized protein C1orf131-like isoform X1 [Cimex lectularius]XP_024083573.1 uncharacterized protein C1orf131-like isoform X1 [Cimex lectularius]XP_024083574.1 uncharacterized protein C1orf131-like isoform X1 [Cimex lectularius]